MTLRLRVIERKNMDKAGRGKGHEGWFEQGKCILLNKVDCWL